MLQAAPRVDVARRTETVAIFLNKIRLLGVIEKA
jgi:hypothetical protein